MTIDDVLHRMRRLSDDGHYADETLIEEWASTIEAAMREKDADYAALLDKWAVSRAEIGKLREVLKAAKDLAEYWIMQGDRRLYSEEEYKTWLALGYHSKAMKQINSALAGKEAPFNHSLTTREPKP